MIEVFDVKRTRSYGCFASFRAATDTLDSLAIAGQLGRVPAVSVSAYRGGTLQREYDAVRAGGKWHVPKAPEKRMPEMKQEMVQGVRHGGADVPRGVPRPPEPQLPALGGQPETVQP